ncbi:MAG: hypothetical protein AAGB01_09715, partial [Cyanobacteria bacterium P01_F01_bin.42]
MPMERIAEPDLMDGWEQAIAYAQADFEVPHSAFIEKLNPDCQCARCVDVRKALQNEMEIKAFIFNSVVGE